MWSSESFSKALRKAAVGWCRISLVDVSEGREGRMRSSRPFVRVAEYKVSLFEWSMVTACSPVCKKSTRAVRWFFQQCVDLEGRVSLDL